MIKSIVVAGLLLSLAGCQSPLQQYADDQSNITNAQIEIDQREAALLLAHDRRITALEAARAADEARKSK